MAAKEGCLGGSDWRETIAAADVTVCQHFPVQPTSGFSSFRQVSAGTGRRCSNRYSYRGNPSALSRRDWRCGITSPPSGVGRGELAVIREPRVVVGPVWDRSKSPLILVHDTIRYGACNASWRHKNLERNLEKGTGECAEMGDEGWRARSATLQGEWRNGGEGLLPCKRTGLRGRPAMELERAMVKMASYLKVAKLNSRSRWSSSSACSAANVAAKPMHHREAKNPTRTTFYSWNIGGGCSGLICIVPCIPRLAKCNVIASDQ